MLVRLGALKAAEIDARGTFRMIRALAGVVVALSLAQAAERAELPLLLSMDLPSSSQSSPPDAASLAKNPSGTLVVSGVTLDSMEAAIVGAKVTLRGAGSEATASTDVTGAFRFTGLSSAVYELQAEAAGFKSAKVRLKLGPGPASPVRIIMSIDERHEEITVSASADRVNTDIGGNLDVVTLNRETLDNLPIEGGDVLAAISKLAGASGGLLVVVDGVVSSDRLAASEIKEVRINQNPYSAEFSQPGQARVEITTKTGSSHYHGSLNFQFRHYVLDARNAFAVQRPQEEHRLWDGYFSGPLGRSKKATFTLSGYRAEDDLQPVVYALLPYGTLQQNFANPQRTTALSAKVNWQVGRSNTLSIRYRFSDWSDKGEGVGGLTLPDAAADARARSHTLTLTDRTAVRGNVLNELSIRAESSSTLISSRLPGSPSIIVLGAFTGGGAGQNLHETHTQVQLNDTLSWSLHKQVIKAGIYTAPTRIGLNDRSNFDGTFQFSSLRDYTLGRPFSFSRQQGDSRLAFWEPDVGLFLEDDISVRPNLSFGVGLRYDWQRYISDYNNLAPRLSVAYAPGANRKTVLRAGAGFFYSAMDRTAIGDMLRFNGSRLQQVVLLNPGYPDPFLIASVSQQQPITIVRLAPDLRSPYTIQYSFGIEQQLRKSLAFTGTYRGSRGLKLFRSRDVNAPLPPLYGQRPNAAIGILRQIESSGRLQDNSVKLALTGSITRFFVGQAQYAYGRAYDDTSGIKAFPAKQYDLSGEWSRAEFDVRHFFYLYGTLKAGKFFKLGAIASMSSGKPYTITTGHDDYGTSFANARPPGVPRNSREGPGSATVDLRWSRDFRVIPAKKDDSPIVTLGLDAFNILNRVNYNSYVGDLSSPFFGRPVSAQPARHLQTSLTFAF